MLKAAMLDQSHTIATALKILHLKTAQKLKSQKLAFAIQKTHGIINRQSDLLRMTL